MDREYINSLLSNVYDYYLFFREQIGIYGFNGFLSTFNIEYIHEWFLKNDPNNEYKLFVCLIEKDKFNKFILYLTDHEALLSTFIEKSNAYYSLFYECDYNSFEILFEAYKNDKTLNSNFISFIPGDILLSYIDKTDNEEDIITILNNSGNARKEFFLNDSRGYKYIKEGKVYPELIINDKIKLSNDIVGSYPILNALKSPNIVEFRNKFNNFIKINPSYKLEDMLNKYEDSVINKFDINTGLISDFNGIDDIDSLNEKLKQLNDNYLLFNLNTKNNIKDELKKVSEEKVSQLIIDRLFKDNYYNVGININEMLRYQDSIGENIFDDETISLYKNVSDWSGLSMIDKLNIYNTYKNSNLNTKFYEDINKCRIHSYDRIKDELYIPNVKNDQLSKKYGVDIYYLDGENFSMVVRGLNKKYKEKSSLKRECFSLINNDNTSTINSEYHYGYYNFDVNKIFSVSEQDAFSWDRLDEGNNKRINRIMTSDELASYSDINEIQIKKDDTALHPDYVVAFNKISLDEVEEASRLNIPIVLINKKKYNKKSLKQINIFDNSNLYVNDIYDENIYKMRH